MNTEKLKRIIIEVEDNPNIGSCSITEHFNEHHKNGIIDLVKHKIFKKSDTSGIFVIDTETKHVLFELEGQEGLRLNKLSEWLIDYLEIDITNRNDNGFVEI